MVVNFKQGMQKLDHRPELDHGSKKKGLQIIQNSTIQSLCSYRVGQGQLMPCCRCFSSERGSSFSYMERRWSISIRNRGVGMTKCLVGTSPRCGDNLPHRIGLTNLPKNEGPHVPIHSGGSWISIGNHRSHHHLNCRKDAVRVHSVCVRGRSRNLPPFQTCQY